MDLDSLFKWKKELIIKDSKGEPVRLGKKPLKLYQRIVGDADLVKARSKALLASRRLRGNLKDETSEEYAALIPDYEGQANETLSNMIVFAEGIDLRRRAVEQAEKPREPKKPKEDASLEDMENYEAATSEYQEQYDKAINKQMDKLIKERLTELSKLTREEIVNIFLVSIIESICRTEMLRVFNCWCTYLGTYADKEMTVRAFSSYEDFDNAATELRNQMLSGYLELEMTGETLKN